jgi:hypothetical protein
VRPLDEALAALSDALLNGIGRWNSIIVSIREETRRRVYSLTLQFFRGDEKDCGQWWGSKDMDSMSIFWYLRRAYFEDSSITHRMQINLKGVVREFLTHVERHHEAWGIDPETLTRTAVKPDELTQPGLTLEGVKQLVDAEIVRRAPQLAGKVSEKAAKC